MLLIALAAQAEAAGEPLDEARWRALFKAHGPFLRSSVARLTGLGSHVDDIVQEAFVTAYRKRDDLPTGEHKMRAWLYRTARNHWLHHQRGTARRLGALDRAALEPAGSSPDPTENLEADDAVRLVQFGLNRIPEDAREVFVLVELEGLSSVDAAEILELNENTLRARLRRGRGVFREAIEPMLAREGSES